VIRRILIALTLILPLCSYAQDPKFPELSAQTTDTDLANGDQVFTGNAKLSYEGVLLVADEIRVNAASQTASAKGHVVLTIDSNLAVTTSKGRELTPKGSKRLLADEIVYFIRDRSFTGKKLRFGEFPVFVSGGKIDARRDEITIDDATVFYQEPGPFAPSLMASHLRIVGRDKIVAQDAWIGLGSKPLIPFRSITQNVEDPLISHMTARIGFKRSLGAFADLGLHLPVSPGVKLGGDVGLYTSRGLLAGPSGTYKTGEGDTLTQGAFSSGYISDRGDKGEDILYRQIHSNRGYAHWEESRHFGDGHTTANTELNYWSDSGLLRDFRPNQFYNNQQPDTFVDITNSQNNLVSSLFFRVQPNTYYHVQQRLPELRVDLLPSTFGNRFYQRSNFSLAALRERQLNVNDDGTYSTAPTVKSDRADWFYSIDRPITPTDWFTFDPVAGGRATHYFDALDGKGSYTRVLGEAGFDASLRASGVYDYKNERWDINGIRHLITPKLSYRYIPKADKGRQYIPQIDDRVFDTSLPTLELGEQRNIDDLSAQNVLRIGVDNTFQTRDKTYGSRDLLIVNLAADYRFHREAGMNNTSEIHTGVSFMPSRWARFDVYNSFDPHTKTTRELNTRFTLHDGNVWSLSLSNDYLQHQIDEYIAEGRYRLNEVYQVLARLHFDARKSRFNERSIALRQNLDNIWSIQYGVSYFEGRKRESNFGFSVEVRLAGF
jgi:LPS-assembly protein